MGRGRELGSAGSIAPDRFTPCSRPPAADRADVWTHGYAWNRVAPLGTGHDLWETWDSYRSRAGARTRMANRRIPVLLPADAGQRRRADALG